MLATDSWTRLWTLTSAASDYFWHLRLPLLAWYGLHTNLSARTWAGLSTVTATAS